MGVTSWKLVALALVGVALAAWGSYGPFLFPTCCHEIVTPFNQAWLLLVLLVWVGLMLASYVRDASGRMWKLALAYLAAYGVWVAGYIPFDAAWSLERLVANVHQVVLGHMALAFPSGRFVSRFDRSFVLLAYGWVVGLTALYLLFWETPEGWPANVFAIWPNNEIASVINNVALAGAPVLVAIVLWRLWRRWSRATPAGRRVLTPLAIAMPVGMAVIGMWHVADLINRDEIRVALQSPLPRLTQLLFPAGFLVGLLRTRLARGSIADLAVQLGAGVRLGQLEPILARTLRDPTLELVFPAPIGDGFVHSDGRPFSVTDQRYPRATTPLRRDGELLALLIHDPDLESEDPDLVRAVGSVAGLALANERLSAQVRAQLAEVRASRARIVEAADSERRRIERDLHDGAQQRLLALATRLQTAKSTVHGAAALVDEATAELQAAVSEVRELARGLHPPILTDMGLGPALDALAERATVPVEVRAPDRRYPATIESAIYYVVSEALTNVARHAGATAARVMVRDEEARLVVEVADDGRGGADIALGSGLRGLIDRIAALGGGLTIESPPGGGTTIRGAVPL